MRLPCLSLLLCLFCLLCSSPASSAHYIQKRQSVNRTMKLLPEETSQFIHEQYSGAIILWFEKEETGYEVGIQDEGIKKKIRFGKEHVWLTTVWEINPEDVPENIVYALEDSAYTPSNIEEVTVTETPEGLFYTLKLKQLNNEVEITVDALGKIMLKV
jgi:hypothetical protein